MLVFMIVLLLVCLMNNDPSEAELIAFLKTSLAGYKVPKSILLTEEVKRAPNGKANYKWAKEFAESSLS